MVRRKRIRRASEQASTPLSRSAVSREIVLGVTDTSQMDRQGKEKSMMLRFGWFLPSQTGSCTVSILKSLSFVRVHILFVGIWHRDRLQSHGFPVGLAPVLPLQPTRDKIVIVRLGARAKKFRRPPDLHNDVEKRRSGKSIQ